MGRNGLVLRCEKAVARMEPTGRREAPPDDRLREIRDSRDAGPGLRFAPFYHYQVHTRPRVQRASGVPHALFGRKINQRLGRIARRGRERVFGVEMSTLVMPGLDPGIHQSSQDHFRRRWIAGSSPAMTE